MLQLDLLDLAVHTVDSDSKWHTSIRLRGSVRADRHDTVRMNSELECFGQTTTIP